MRLRLLIDAEVPDETIAILAEILAEQPRTDMTITSEDGTVQQFTGRFVGVIA